jgi:serine/threonine protein kinase
MQFVGGGTLQDCLKRLEDVPMHERSGSDLMSSIGHHLELCGLEPSVMSNSVGMLNHLDWPATVAWVGSQLSEGLDYAHQKKVLHRDIKPANILFAADGTPRLVDFNVSFSGIAGRAGAAVYFGGSLAYMSPEQIEISLSIDGGRSAEELDRSSDLYSLGMVLWEMLHGSRPWINSNRPASWTEALNHELELRQRPLKPIATAKESVPSPSLRVLEHSLQACLNVEPTQRPASGRHLTAMLRLALFPNAARRILPQHNGLMKALISLPPWLLLVLGGLMPNGAAAIFNFLYNSSQIVETYPDLWNKFFLMSTSINLLFFPIGIAWVIHLIVKHSRSLKVRPIEGQPLSRPRPPIRTASFEPDASVSGPQPEISADFPLFRVDRSDLASVRTAVPVKTVTNCQNPNVIQMLEERSDSRSDSMMDVETPASTSFSSLTNATPSNKFAWDLGHQIALICGGLWLLAGFIFPILLLSTHHQFRWLDALHFFLSLTICGAVAMVYPFYWITCLNLVLYYPMTVCQQLHDPSILVWGNRLRRLSRRYLITAAAIPLIALLLLVTAVEAPRPYLVATILTTAAGFAASIFAVQLIDDFVLDIEPAVRSAS